MDFYMIAEELNKNGELEIYANFIVRPSKDLMIRGGAFYAIWDNEKGLWSTDEYDVVRLVDKHLDEYAVKYKGTPVRIKYLRNFDSGRWVRFQTYVKNMSNSFVQLDDNLAWSNTEVKKTDYCSKRLPYPVEEGSIEAWDEIVSTLYSPEERQKIEWAIGAIASGDSKKIQKFLVFYGPPGSGKGTILNIIELLFQGYCAPFDAKAIGSASNTFALDAFRDNPLVAIQQDGDLSKIADNTMLNSLISHEIMSINEKFKSSYSATFSAFCLLGTNKPVKITDSKSGIIRRLIDVRPSGITIPVNRYTALNSQVEFELGAIIDHCLKLYRELGKSFYSGYRPEEMMLQTDPFFNYIEANFVLFRDQDGVSLKQAYKLYTEYCEETGMDIRMPQYKLRDELKNYFEDFHARAEVDGITVYSWYSGFESEKFRSSDHKEPEVSVSLVIDEDVSLLDEILADQLAQYSKEDGSPSKKWTVTEKEKLKGYTPVTTTLKDIDTSKEHYTQLPDNHIVIDFDLTDDSGEKSLEKNLEAASKWPPTYSEFSKSGKGVHLHYIYNGDAKQLERLHGHGIEVKVPSGNFALRRRLTKCNSVPIATISSGLKTKEKKEVFDEHTIKSEKLLRDLIDRNLRKEIHTSTKPSIDFIAKILDDAYNSDLKYDVTNMRGKILGFANRSTNQAREAVRVVSKMKFQSKEDVSEVIMPTDNLKDDRLAIFDVEVFPNLFVICWKFKGGNSTVKMINPTAAEVEEVLKLKLVGYNCRKYDNHILYAASLGYTNYELYMLSKRLINGDNAYFGAAYGISFADMFDISSLKQSLKKFQIQLGITHIENPHDWDEPVDEKDIPEIVEYCCNDVDSLEAVIDERHGDWVAREILAELSGLPMSATTANHTARIIFGENKNPQSEFIYTDLSKEFKGYTYDMGKSTYHGELIGEGGLVRANPGMWVEVITLDVASMHPTSIEELELFGPYTKNFSALKRARIAIKRGEHELAATLLDGRLKKYLFNDKGEWDEKGAEALSYALKIVINIVYGLTCASFDNPFRDRRNKDNIVAKRGALFMLDLKIAVEAKGFNVVHIKTDSIKIANPTEEIIDFVMDYGIDYGYEFEHEVTYEKFCLVNDAVYIAKAKAGKKPEHWEAVGAQFAHPYVFKTMFSKEAVNINDLVETKQVTTSLWLDFEKPPSESDAAMALADEPENRKQFIGKIGGFIPVTEGGGVLLRQDKNGKYAAAAGSKGHLWMESEVYKAKYGGKSTAVDWSYYTKLVNSAASKIGEFGNLDEFVDSPGTLTWADSVPE